MIAARAAIVRGMNEQLRRRSVGAPAARSALLTMLGEYVLPSAAIDMAYSTDVRPIAVTARFTSTGSLKRSGRANVACTATRGVAPNVRWTMPSAVCSSASAASARRKTVVQW